MIWCCVLVKIRSVIHSFAMWRDWLSSWSNALLLDSWNKMRFMFTSKIAENFQDFWFRSRSGWPILEKKRLFLCSMASKAHVEITKSVIYWFLVACISQWISSQVFDSIEKRKNFTRIQQNRIGSHTTHYHYPLQCTYTYVPTVHSPLSVAEVINQKCGELYCSK